MKYRVMGNKGGITIRMDFYDSSICFICAHFHPNRDNVQGRNMDFQNIVDNAIMSPVIMSPVVDSVLNFASSEKYKPSHQNVPLNILSHDYIFWLGDLNYRITEDVDTNEVFEKCMTGDWEYLRSKDQLNIERTTKNVFQDFDEGLLSFAPTYKYQPGTDSYDCRPGKKIRAPAWYVF